MRNVLRKVWSVESPLGEAMDQEVPLHLSVQASEGLSRLLCRALQPLDHMVRVGVSDYWYESREDS